MATMAGYRPTAALMTCRPSTPGSRRSVIEDVEGELVEQLQRLFAGFGLDDLETPFPEPFRHERPQGGLVVDEQEVGGGLGHLGAPTY